MLPAIKNGKSDHYLLAFVLQKESVSTKVVIGTMLITAGSIVMLWK